MQPISENCYSHVALSRLDSEFLQNTEDAEEDERVGSLYSVVQLKDDGNCLYNQFEKQNGGWLLLFLKYTYKAGNNKYLNCFANNQCNMMHYF